ncbi:MAG: DUF3109 family protein [Chlorobium sp.]|jgi:hypothetical protein|uniref:DUF3109 family protein n=1 Tax=Chlorobium sp. TaxID=1095 RepID=UPI001D89BD82|nr:DUF3109 family protein [Chlorobium sp.]MBN1279095.1 DUF3109 family protein [Chlorobiaceae bacterium]MCF8215824.1 DUF3109 family protein [Chlorobium sp.]MCF8270722.1 DUF3109 family protein [Chlorobium sp.]MCF8287034.1 DUF3109 family protein [Chlorobium sp.]MCF8290691.1 DUF3109 family protein [Chlorobium sp.]
MKLVSIGNVLIEPEVLHAAFVCDLRECRGACCIEGELGAPLNPAEARQLEDAPDELVRMLPEKNIRYLRRYGAVEVYQGVQYTRTIGNRECVYAFEREGITFCAVEVAFREGAISFDKPISCRLFPVRVRRKFGLDYLVYEQHQMCRSARKLGRERRIKLLDYIADALETVYGTQWIDNLKAFADSSPKSSCQK